MFKLSEIHQKKLDHSEWLDHTYRDHHYNLKAAIRSVAVDYIYYKKIRTKTTEELLKNIKVEKDAYGHWWLWDLN